MIEKTYPIRNRQSVVAQALFQVADKMRDHYFLELDERNSIIRSLLEHIDRLEGRVNFPIA